jgi:Ni,Fe-hydrogenase I cytochrome b subunit
MRSYVHICSSVRTYTHTYFDIRAKQLGFRRFMQCAWFFSTEKMKPSNLMAQNIIFLSAVCCCHIINSILVMIISSYFFPPATCFVPSLAMVVLYNPLPYLVHFLECFVLIICLLTGRMVFLVQRYNYGIARQCSCFFQLCSHELL